MKLNLAPKPLDQPTRSQVCRLPSLLLLQTCYSVRLLDHNECSNHEKFNRNFPYQVVCDAVPCIVHHSAFAYHPIRLVYCITLRGYSVVKLQLTVITYTAGRDVYRALRPVTRSLRVRRLWSRYEATSKVCKCTIIWHVRLYSLLLGLKLYSKLLPPSLG